MYLFIGKNPGSDSISFIFWRIAGCRYPDAFTVRTGSFENGYPMRLFY